MISYSVVDLSGDGRSLSLLDASGGLHVVRVEGAPIDRDAVLMGREASLGAQVLMSASTHGPVRVNFQAVGCSQLQALSLLHPMPTASSPPPQRRGQSAEQR